MEYLKGGDGNFFFFLLVGKMRTWKQVRPKVGEREREPETAKRRGERKRKFASRHPSSMELIFTHPILCVFTMIPYNNVTISLNHYTLSSKACCF